MSDRITNASVFSSQSLAASVDSSPVLTHGYRVVSFQIDESGGPGTHVGTLAIMGRANPSASWTALRLLNATTGAASSSIAVSNGAAIGESVVLPDHGMYEMMLRYTFTSGTGTVNAYVNREN